MTETANKTLTSALPQKRRYWVLAILVALTTCGGAYWWRNRLTEEECLFVGRWAHFEPNVSMQFPTKTWELDRDRSMRQVARGSSISVGPNSRFIQASLPLLPQYQWRYRSGNLQVTKRESLDRTVHDWINSGMKTWGSEWFRGRINIVDHDTIEITLLNQQTGQPTTSVIWKRVITK